VMIGALLSEHIERPMDLLNARVIATSSLVRLGLLPIVFLLLASYLPVSVELKQVLVVQAAMPTATFPIVMAKHYGGHPQTAVQIVAGTTVIGLFLIPVWIAFGLSFVGV